MKLSSVAVIFGCVVALGWLTGFGRCYYAYCDKPCQCRSHNFSVNFEKVADKLSTNLTVQDNRGRDKYIYFLSLCSPIQCSFEFAPGDAAACQYVISQNIFTKLGEAKGAEWTIVNQTVFNVIYPNGKHDDITGADRRTQVFFTIDDSVDNPSIVFDKEDDDDTVGYHTYIFRVVMNSKDAGAGGRGWTCGTICVIGVVLAILLVVLAILYCLFGCIMICKLKMCRSVDVPYKQLPEKI